LENLTGIFPSLNTNGVASSSPAVGANTVSAYPGNAMLWIHNLVQAWEKFSLHGREELLQNNVVI